MPTLEHAVSAQSTVSVIAVTIPASIVPAGVDRYGVVKVAYFGTGGPTIVGVTWGGVSLLANVIKNAVHDGANRKRLAWFFYLNPPLTPAAITVTLSAASLDFGVLAEAWSGVHQTTPFTGLTFTADANPQLGHPTSLTVPSADGDVVTDALYVFSSAGTLQVTAGAGQTSIAEVEDASVNGFALGSSRKPGAASVVMTWTNNRGSGQWCAYGISLKPAPTSGGGSMSYRSRVLADGAIAYWRLNEPTGTTASDSAGTRHGTISATGVTRVAGVGGQPAMAFDGLTGRIDCPALPSLSTPHTFEAWAYRTNTPDGTTIALTRPGFGVGAFVFGTSQAAAGVHRGAILYPAVVNYGSDPLFPVNDAWHHYVSVYDGAQVHMYIDGVDSLDPTTATITDVSAATPVILGFNADVGTPRGVTLQDVAVYAQALTPAQILAHFNARNDPEPGTGGTAGVPGWFLGVGDDRMATRYNTWRAITPSNTIDLPTPTDAILVGGAGDIAAVMENNQVVVLTLPAGAWVPIAARRINATGTSATGLVALNDI